METTTGERIWHRFLTDQDRAHLAASRDRRVGFGDRPALLLVDLYRWVFGDRPEPLLEAVKRWPGSCGPVAWQTLPRIQQVLAAARQAGIPVLHVTGLDEASSGVPGWNEAIHGGAGRATRGSRPAPASPDSPDGLAAQTAAGARGAAGTAIQAAPESEAAARQRRRYDILDEVAPIAGEVVLRKTAPSAFWGTPLIGQLVHLGVDTLIVAGESTSGCVRATVVDAASHRLRVIVVEEAVFDRHEAAHAINLFDMHQKYADVLPLADVLAHLRTIHARSGAEARTAASG